MTKLRATLIYMLKEKEPQINKTKHRLLRGILMETLNEIKEQAMNKLEDLINKRITSFQAQIRRRQNRIRVIRRIAKVDYYSLCQLSASFLRQSGVLSDKTIDEVVTLLTEQ